MDLVELADRLRHWAAAELLPGADVDGVAPMPGNAGLSFGFDVVDQAVGLRRPLVIRFAPPGVRRADNTDVLRQVPLLSALQRNRIPVAPVIWSTADPIWFGTDAIVQERLSARPMRLWGPATGRRPSGGDVAPLLLRAVQTLAALHALDWRQVLSNWETPRSASDELAHWDRLLDKHPDPAWAQGGRELSRVDSGPHRIGFFHGDYHTNIILFDGDGPWLPSSTGRSPVSVGPASTWAGSRCRPTRRPGIPTNGGACAWSQNRGSCRARTRRRADFR